MGGRERERQTEKERYKSMKNSTGYLQSTNRNRKKSLTSGKKKGSSYLMSSRICVDLTAQNLDKKDLFSESDPFYLVYRTNEDGEDTLVHRSEWIKVHMASPSTWCTAP